MGNRKVTNLAGVILMVIVVLSAFGLRSAERFDQKRAAEKAEAERARVNASFNTQTGVGTPPQASNPAPGASQGAGRSSGPSGSYTPPEKASAAAPVIVEPAEEMAKPGTYRGSVVVCKFGLAPRQQAWGTVKEKNLCLKMSPELVVKMSWNHVESAGVKSKLFMDGSEYPVDYLMPGDFVEARVGTDSLGAVVLTDVRLLKR